MVTTIATGIAVTTVIVASMAILASGINNRLDDLIDDLNAMADAYSAPAATAGHRADGPRPEPDRAPPDAGRGR